jgi:uncharacterized Ntn-hydrolase superfamily protein
LAAARVRLRPRRPVPLPLPLRTLPLALALVLALAGPPAAPVAQAADMQGTLSIVGMDGRTGELGVIVVSRTPAVGNVAPWVQAGVGAMATQGDVNASWGPLGLALLRGGMAPQSVVDSLCRADSGFVRRQVGLLDRHGMPGGFTGLELVNWSGGVLDSFVAVQGNSLPRPDVVHEAHRIFRGSPDRELAERLLASLDAALAADSTARRGLVSAALLVGRSHPGRPEDASRYVFVRVDEADDPVAALHRQLAAWQAMRLVGAHLEYAELARRSAAPGAPAVAGEEEARARAIVTRALADSAAGAPELNAMAWALARRGLWLADARQAAARALALAPARLDVIDTNVEVALRQGRWDDAKGLVDMALVLSPHDEYMAERARVVAKGSAAAAGKDGAKKPGSGRPKK